jgi:hypothetical protein
MTCNSVNSGSGRISAIFSRSTATRRLAAIVVPGCPGIHASVLARRLLAKFSRFLHRRLHLLNGVEGGALSGQPEVALELTELGVA